MKPINPFFYSLLGLLFLSGCGSDSLSNQTKIHFYIENHFSQAPESVLGMDCLAVNIMGDGIESVLPDSHPRSLLTDALSGSVCGYIGVTSEFISAETGGEVTLSVPTGFDRLIQVLGFVMVDETCPSGTFGEYSTTMSGVYEVGREITDILGEKTITLENTYTPDAENMLYCTATSLALTTTPSYLFVSEAITLVATGGVSPYTYSLNTTSTATGSIDQDTAVFFASSAGVATIDVTDMDGNVASVVLNVFNNPEDIGILLTAWYRADDLDGDQVVDPASSSNDGTEVTTWKDGAGDYDLEGTTNITPTFITSDATMSLPALSFDGTDDFLRSSTTGSSDTDGLSIYIVANISTVDENHTLISHGSLSDSSFTNYEIFTNTVLGQVTYAYEYIIAGNYEYKASLLTPTASSWTLIEAHRSGGPEVTIVVNGNEDSLTALVGATSGSSGRIFVGRSSRDSDAPEYFKGSLAEILIFQGLITNDISNRTTVRCYLSNKYSLSLTDCD